MTWLWIGLAFAGGSVVGTLVTIALLGASVKLWR